MKTRLLGLLVCCGMAVSYSGFADGSGKTAVELPGKRPDGSVLLPNQWSLRPAGIQVPLGDFPVNIAVHPDGRFAAVLHSGHGAHEIRVIDLQTAQEVSSVKMKETFYGLEFSHGGNRLYCSGSSEEVIHLFDFKNGKLTPNSDIRLCPEEERGIPCGLAVSEDSRDLYVANVWGQYVSKVDLMGRRNAAEIILGPKPPMGVTIKRKTQFEKEDPDPDPDFDAITKREDLQFETVRPEAPFPYACRLDDKRHLLYVSLWAQAAVAVVDLRSNEVIARWPTEDHPNEMLLTSSGKYLFVANANRNTVTVINTLKGKTVETLFTSLGAPPWVPGSTPNSLALSPDENTLYVANACNNDIAVFDVTVPGKSRSLGFIPVGWYPTSVRVTPDGKYLLVANGKGLISKANPNGPVPGKKRTPDMQYIDELFPGTLSIIELPKGKTFRKELARYTEEAYHCTPQFSVPTVKPAAGNPIPTAVGKGSPIEYCIYIIKENRTYDQVLGDMKEGNGDPKLCLFPERVTPNLHKISRDFVLLDNFYVDAEVSADGHEWSMGANASDFVEKTWPLNYRHSKKFPYPSEGRFPVATAPGGYLWDRAAEAGVTYRSYGEFVFNGKKTNEPCWTRTKALQGHFDPWFHCFDTGYPDAKRAARYLEELKQFEAQGEMPRLQIIRMPDDHTSGSVPGKPTPSAQVADNDRAVGVVVEALSHSKFWPEMAIFILEDDAQNGPDHIDAHRSTAYLVSPYIRRHNVDSTMYSTSSMLRTMELILGLKPMTQYDAAATPMYNAFQAKPDLQPFDALQANVDLNEKNTLASWGSRESMKMDFSKEDAADEQKLNEIIWRSVRGADNPMPAPTRAAFVLAQPKDDDGD